MPGLHTGELRIGDTIAGHDNLRIIFFVGNEDVRDPLPMIWVLNVFQKKRDHFTTNEIRIFKSQRTLVLQRFYENRP